MLTGYVYIVYLRSEKLLTAVCNAVLALLDEWEGMMIQNLMATVLRSSIILAASLIAQSFLLLIPFGGVAWADPKAISLVNISQNALYDPLCPVLAGYPAGGCRGSLLAEVWVAPHNPNVVAVAYRTYGLPINTNADKDARTADAHVSISVDSGNRFRDTNLMPILREPAVNINEPEPDLYFCNIPHVAFSSDGFMFAGCSFFTALGNIGPLPKQGRVTVTASRDFGLTWSAPTYGLRIGNFSTGLTGLNGGTAPEDTPWDGSHGFSDLQGPYYTTSGGYVVVSLDHAKSWGTVYELDSQSLPGWTVSGVGVMNAAHGVLGAPFAANATPIAGPVCPCLGYATSLDYGKTWSAQLVAEADQFNSNVSGDTARSPFSASDPSTPGTGVAISAYTPDHTSVQVFYTEDGGRKWKSAAAMPYPTGVNVTNASHVGVGYTRHGRVLLVWRGFEVSGAFNTFAALLNGNHFGQTIRVSPQPSTYPLITDEAACEEAFPEPPPRACYDTTSGGGDFSTWITGNDRYAFVGFPYIPDGLHEDIYLAKIPLSTMH